MDYATRGQQIRESVRRRNLHALAITHPANIRYLSGFTGSSGVLLASQVDSVLFTDGRYTAQARAEVNGAKVVIARGSVLAALANWLGSHKSIREVGFEAEHLSVAMQASIRKELPGRVRMRASMGLVENLRIIKEPAELDRIRDSVLLASRVFNKTLESIKPGASEISVAAEFEYAARCAGAEKMSFPTIVAAGERSALPHGVASNQRIPRRGFVLLDCGVILGGYCSDMSRTVHVGKPGTQARRMYDAVRQAQQAALAAVRPGVQAGEVDRAARRVLQQAGYARYFTHSTGHGIGLEIHEPPRLGRGQREKLRPGMVITIEPGVYVPGEGGVRIEDTVAVKENGCEVLTPTPKDLITL
jgi:Xaa-Pro aminopeptidase